MKRAKLKIYYGPMYSGKSVLLIKDIFANIEKSKLVFKPKEDIRSEKVYTREGLEFDAIQISEPSEIMNYIEDWIERVYLDEINFFDDSLVQVIEELLQMGIDVIVAGLDRNYRAEFFLVSIKLIELADKGIKIKAKCYKCEKGASLTTRFIDGKPDSKDSLTNISDKLNKNIEYFPACDEHHPFLNKDK